MKIGDLDLYGMSGFPLLPFESIIQSHSPRLYTPYNKPPNFLRRRTRVDGLPQNAKWAWPDDVNRPRPLSRTDSRALRAEYCIVGVPHNTAI